MDKLIVYIDGFNLFYGLRDLAGQRFKWLDVVALSRSLRRRSNLVQVKYFTAPVLNYPDGASRQATYQRALLAHNPGMITIEQGRYQSQTMECRGCGRRWRSYEEKETDVNIATALVADAAMGTCTATLIVSADSDLAPAVRTARVVAPQMFIAAAFPPKRHSAELETLMPASFHIGTAKVRKALLPDVVEGPGGIKLHRPRKWY